MAAEGLPDHLGCHQVRVEVAGRILARCIAARDVTLFEYFRTDKAGHAGERDRCEEELRRVDALVGACLDELASLGIADQTLVLLSSDHGNIEDLSTRTHTRNPVPLLAWGANAREAVGKARDITDVVSVMLGP